MHGPDKTSQTMAYYDESHIAKIYAIKRIREDFFKKSKTTRVPLDFIQDKLGESFIQISHENKYKTHIEPVKKSGHSKKKQIIQDAIVLYTTKGYRKTTLKDVSRKAGVSMPSLYHYFPEKRDLFIEVIEYVIQEWREDLKEALSHSNDPTERGVIRFEVFQKHHPRIGEILDHLSTEASRGDLWAADRLKQVFSRLMESVLESILTSIKKGIMRNLDSELMAYFFIKINEAATQRLALDDKYSPSEIMSFVADLIAFGLLTPERQKRMAEKQKKY